MLMEEIPRLFYSVVWTPSTEDVSAAAGTVFPATLRQAKQNYDC